MDPAPALGDLLARLRDEHRDDFLYRGQTKVWPRPLLPSAYRPYRKSGRTYTRDSPEFVHALRKIGQEFAALEPVNVFDESVPFFYPDDEPPGEIEIELLKKLSNDQYLARTLADGPAAIETMVTPLEALVFRHRFDLWKQVIDYDHRVQIRDMVFMRPFGYLLGQALAQQYGFASEMLDVTTDLDVAAFFATHDGPAFLRAGDHEIGVIYRFRRTASQRISGDPGSYDFYSCPPLLVMDELVAPFRVESGDGGTRQEVETFLAQSFEQFRRWRRWEAFRIHRSVLEETRVARQHAAFVVPDVIYVDSGTRPRPLRSLMAIEDCASREGTEAFCFRHTGAEQRLVRVRREELWPNESDALFEMIGNALLTSVVLDSGQILPSRIDLLHPGYDPFT